MYKTEIAFALNEHPRIVGNKVTVICEMTVT